MARLVHSDDDPIGMARGRSTDEYVQVLACTTCPRVSSVTARGWKAYLVDDDPADDEGETLAFQCPDCARRGLEVHD
ncbi:MAG: hypothetical protein ACRDNB_06065 [Gaiellaceae bacterium]